MFGNDNQQDGQQTAPPMNDQNQWGANPTPSDGQDQNMGTPSTDAGLGAMPADNDIPSAPSMSAPSDQNFGSNDATMPSLAMPETPAPTEDTTSHDDTTPSTDSSPTDDHSDDKTDDLLDLKQQALQQLTPLVDHLDLSAEDEFRTTMMMIQASDNKELIPKAYEAAQKITDEKAKAQALLDVVNEINYFTQHKND